MRVEVKFGTQALAVELPDGPTPPTLLRLKEQLYAQTGVLPAMQKLLGKPKLNDPDSDDKSLLQLGVRNNAKLMLIGAAVAEVVSVNTVSAAQKRQEEERVKLLRNLERNIWLLPSFAGFMADPYVEGKGFPLEGGGVALALLTLDVALSRINTLGVTTSDGAGTAAFLLHSLGKEGQATISHPLLRQLSAADIQSLQRAHGALRRCYYFAQEAERAQGPEQVLAIVKKAVSVVSGLARGEWLLMPSGWVGLKAANAVYLLIHRRGPEVFDVVVVNRGSEGVSYHPSWQTAEKIVSCPLLRFEGVASARLLDPAFWLLLLSLRMRGNAPENRSEYIREEVFYDVLLPWLVERGRRLTDPPRFATEMLLSSSDNHDAEEDEAAAVQRRRTQPATDAAMRCFPAAVHEHSATVARSASSAIKGAVTALVYLLEQYGVRSRPVQKSIKYALKYEFMMRAAEDLSVVARRFLRGCRGGGDDDDDEADDADGALGNADAGAARIRRALRQLRSAGVDDTVSAATMDDLWRTARASNIVLVSGENVLLAEDHFKAKTVLVYCGGLQAPPCKKFSALLSEATPRLLGAVAGVELLFLSCDRDRQAYEEHASMFTFPRAAYPCTELLKQLDISHVPELLLFAADGRLVHRRGVAALRTDPEAALFPRGPWTGATPLRAVDVAMFRCGAAQLAHHTNKRLTGEGGALSEADATRVLELLVAVQCMVEALPKEPQTLRSGLATNGVSEEHVDNTELQEGEEREFRLSQQCRVAVEDSAFANTSLLPSVSTVAYYGQPVQTVLPEMKEMSDMRRVTGWSQLDVALRRAVEAVDVLWLRARHSCTNSRVAIQMHIIELISWIFLEIVPLPLPPGTDVRAVPGEERQVVASFYTEEALPEAGNTSAGAGDAQTRIQENIYSLVLSYTTAWQAVEVPTRAFDSKRCLVAMAILVVYDAVARCTRGGGQCSLFASMLNSDGGYYLSTSVGRHALPFVRVSATLELVRPQFLLARSAIVRYITFQQRHCAHELFDLRMPEKLELRKESVTVRFLRRLLDSCGYSLHAAGGFAAAGSEMDMLMQWFCSHRTSLAREHPEFGRLRDMVLLTKFLATMEMRDAQLLRRRRQLDEFATWRLTFDEDAPGRQMNAGWRTNPSPPEWECVLVRGRDSDIADLVVTGFGDRELLYGEGLLLHSPIDVGRLLGVEHPTEDDVLHATAMPTFEGTMSEEESEILLSCLTVPYARLPLVLDFFASQDRHTYLFTPALQSVFCAVLFEPDVFVAPETLQAAAPTMVPMRLTEQQRRVVEQRRLRGDLAAEDFESCLGTTYGLLLNELRHSPASVLDPLRRILEGVREIGPTSVYSANASYVLFIVGVVCDVLAFCGRVRRWASLAGSAQLATITAYHAAMLQFLLAAVQPILREWCQEAAGNDDTPTQCVLHSYLAVIHRAAWKLAVATERAAAARQDLDDDEAEGGGQARTTDAPPPASPAPSSHEHLVSQLESLFFVRTRHSFGMGMQRTQLTAQEGDRLLSPEEKLQRFLQAQGLDTAGRAKKVLEEGQQLMLSGGRRRAVFVQIRGRHYNDTVRLPNLFRSDARSTTESRQLKLPPADVPESTILSCIVGEMHDMLAYIEALPQEELDALFERIKRVVLRNYVQGTAAAAAAAAGSMAGGAPSVACAGGPDAIAAQPSNEEAATSSWRLASPGVYRGPAATGLVLNMHSCELFWRKEELKPVPDSMSHFTDFETILGHDALRCGLVMRHRHRHWVHVVGTPFDVIEWTAPSPLDQGVHVPLVLQGELSQEPVHAASYDGVTFNRVVDVYDEAPWPVRAERWAVGLVRAVLREEFPGGSMKYFPVAEARDAAPPQERPEDGTGGAVRVMRFIMNDAPQYPDEGERATWKELIAYKHPAPHFHVFNLVSHARKMYRSLVFTSNQRYCLHSLALVVRPRECEQLRLTAFQAGELTRRVRCEGCIEIHRYNARLGAREMYLPARLLQGLLPSALLEAFLFWQEEGDGSVIRGYGAGEAQDFWFNYALEVRLRPGKADCVVTRLENAAHRRPRGGSSRATGSGTPAAGAEEEEEVEDGASCGGAQMALLRSALTPLSDATCRWLLRRLRGDVVAAIQWALDPANHDTITAVEGRAQQGAASNAAAETCSDDGALRQSPEEAREGQGLVLLSLLRNPALAPLRQLLTELEDCSHVLVWGRVSPRRSPPGGDEQREAEVEAEAATMADVASIELPRLRARFQPRVDTVTGQLRLHLVDHPGWYVAEADDVPRNVRHDGAGDFLRHLRRPFQQCLTLCNGTGGFALMVPNHEFIAMQVREDPFSPLLLFDRSSLRWRESVASPFYLFAVHPCGSFLTPPTLGAALYYAVVQCATQHYTEAMRTLESCYTDCAFSVEEAFMFSLMERTLPDRFPDAHAVRLKLAHAIQYSPQELPWPLHLELAGYLCKKRHVSQACQLTREEVLDLLRRCSTATPIVRAQLQLWAALVREEQRQTPQALTPQCYVAVKMQPPSMDRCGFPWERLLLYPWSRIEPQRPRRLTYEAPEADGLQEEALVEFLWADKLLLDEETGANSKLGFYFLYCLKNGLLSTKLFGEDVHATLGQLLSRWFHLRHARWGREVQRDGETAALPSWGATVLQLMDLAPAAAWPEAVTEVRAQHRMRQGVNLTTSTRESGAQTTPHVLVRFYQSLNEVARGAFQRQEAVLRQRERLQRSQSFTASSREFFVRMTDHLRPRVVPANTGMEQLRLSFHALSATAWVEQREAEEQTASTHAARMRGRLSALLGAPLSEVELLSSFVRGEAAASAAVPADDSEGPQRGGGRSRLPFDLHQHAQCSTPLARHLLTRLEEDAERFAQQQRRQVHYSLPTLTRERLRVILCDGRVGAVQATLRTSAAELQNCITALSNLSAADAAEVLELTASALHLANDICTPTQPERDTEVDGEAAREEHDGAGARVREYRLQRVQGCRSAVPLEWLLGALLSSDMATDLRAVNPFHGDIERIKAELVLLMLLANRSYMAQQAKQAVQQLVLFLELCARLRGASHAVGDAPVLAQDPDGGRERLQELLQRFSIGVDVGALERGGTHSTDGDGGGGGGGEGGCGLRVLSEEVVALLEGRMLQLENETVELLNARRHYATLGDAADGAAVSLDPRYLLFEFLHNLLLRARQVEMVRWFVANARAGVSRVQQMIMGQGKTTVVGPLLALILADGAQLVTQVMPTALLEQTRGILRRCFSVVVPKQIYTLQFDRAFEDTDTNSIALLQQKLDAAAKTRAILISAPECIKSVFLKAIEQLHLIATTPTEELEAVHGGADERVAVQARGLLRRTQQRSAMADAITPILQLWQRGVLIMDEVDVLLHPLRSELNFPIGLKHPIDLSGPRWTLPMHLLDAVFFYHRGRTSSAALTDAAHFDVALACDAGRRPAEEHLAEEGGAPEERQSLQRTLLSGIRDAIGKGYEMQALQREPHLVLLDHAYYQRLLLPALLPWVQLWLLHEIRRASRLGFHAPTASFAASLNWDSFRAGTTEFLLHPVRPARTSALGSAMNANFTPFAIQLLCLAHDWLHRLLPHVLAKIDRVGFGLMQPQDMETVPAEERERMPLSRRLMAIPFVAKDVPSRSSEFAHPDVVIGLTVLAFRYEGMRLTDVKALLLQLKQDFTRQSGPKEHRPAARLYHHWLRLSVSAEAQGGCHASQNVAAASPASAAAGLAEATPPPHAPDGAPPQDRSGIPLSQLHVTDEVAVHALHHRLRYLPEVAHYYLCSHVFPRTMNFQGMKISACGHELGSSMLFTRRIGFSGTPSNLLPRDLGECFYEPGSDGRVLAVLTDPLVVTTEVLPPDWTPLRVLDRIAAAHPPYHALIDAGALITNMENEDVARYLLSRLPPALFDGVVFLDNKDRQMMLQRGNGTKVPVAQSGVALTRRFTFFDQVHTTGTDVRQAASVTAVVTLGKDMVFRDYAQGAYRMRGVGKGQRLRLYLIPEVLARIHATLGVAATGNRLLDVPAWLLLNSVQMESLQFIKLSMQELANVWRKKALQYLLADSIHFHAHPDLYTDMARCRRFHMRRQCAEAPSLPDLSLLRSAIQEFREPVAYPVDAVIDTCVPFLQRLMEHTREKPQALIAGDAASQQFLDDLMQRLASSLASRGTELTTAASADAAAAMNLDSEVVHEQEEEQEQEQEAEQEEQRVSVASRDDECHIPWRVETLETHCKDHPAQGSCFYPVTRFRVRPQQPLLLVDAAIQVSENYYREGWHGAGERRLKNVFFSLEWVPLPSNEEEVHVLHFGLVTLAEGESLRWMMHHPTLLAGRVAMALRVVSSGRYMDATDLFPLAAPRVWEGRVPAGLPPAGVAPSPAPAPCVERDGALLLYRFVNNDMFFLPGELAVLEEVLRGVSRMDRLQFFTDCLRARRRHRNHWDDAPVAALFVPAEQQEAMRPLAILTALRVGFEALHERAVQTPPPAQLVAQLRSFHARVSQALEESPDEMQPADPSTASLPFDRMARILHDVFPSVAKPFTPHDVEHALRYLCQHAAPGLRTCAATGGGQPHCVPLRRVAEAFPVLQEEFFQARLAATHAPGSPEEEPWHCLRCTLLNDSTLRRCVACDSPRPSAAARGECAATRTDTTDAPWSCSQCTFINASQRQSMCSMCLSANPNPLGDAQAGAGGIDAALSVAWECPPGCWACSVEHGGCSKFNPNDVFYCQVCDKARPDLAALRF
ncbi:uncharacterized protein Tco025E_02741 [Trypanosoma conorhini]|uniref:ubiquitinyl hydrolase 1 n=1 Tax=Trypanosoma conorhini TaxID=83891 RepID=A0A3R7NUB1_9TRYP|nr:uncharacterized protein Tco025E_02741 [Trypanosoma conorhini]RNF23641.1 hypothetical protein Tco025E_02741 [Trypanosoma conorhini]